MIFNHLIKRISKELKYEWMMLTSDDHSMILSIFGQAFRSLTVTGTINVNEIIHTFEKVG